MNTLELKELKEVAQYREECGASMTVNPKVVLYLIGNLEAAAAINTDAAIAEIKLPLAAEVDSYRAFIEDLGIIHSMKAPETDHLLSYYEARGAEKMFNLVEPAVRNFCNPQIARLVLEELAILATDLRAGRKG